MRSRPKFSQLPTKRTISDRSMLRGSAAAEESALPRNRVLRPRPASCRVHAAIVPLCYLFIVPHSLSAFTFLKSSTVIIFSWEH
jgi:hypothetical protein